MDYNDGVILDLPGGNVPDSYISWRKDVINMIENSKFNAVMNVNFELLSLYWHIGTDIINKQQLEGWGSKLLERLSYDLSRRFPDDRGYSVRNLKYMRLFAKTYPSYPFQIITQKEVEHLPIGQVSLAQLEMTEDGKFKIPLTRLSWYHHISLISKVKDSAVRAFYILETTENGWSRDVLMTQIANNYIEAKGKSISNFDLTLPPLQSDLAKYAFKDPYKFSFLGTVALQNELDIEKSLASKISDFLLEMGKGFAYIGRQYHISIEGDDYYIDILMYHLKLHCYVVIELKAVEFKPEFVSKLNFYISAVDDLIKSPEDKPTIGLLLCRTKNNVKAQYALRGITQPMGIAQYETEQLLAEVASRLPQIELIEDEMGDID